jgi:hypothetical protein
VGEQSLGLDDVTTFSVFSMEDGTSLIGALGKRAGQQVFVLGALNGCGEVETLAELELEFDVRTPPLPKGYDQSFVPLTDAIELVPLAIERKVYFSHYDGFDLRVVMAQESDSGWQVEERRHEIHSKRNDTSFDERISSDASGL